MAISMVRKPSETPNIRNIDDIIPFRYAYGNQNGYVIGKGTELSYTINANTFRVNSGRVVLQGVESDVDANGVELVVDIASETRYYVVYYQVNLATNSTNILLSNYDTAGYPTIDLGDDLTVNSSGIARLPLYRFSVTNGTIGNVEKVVQEIKYTKDVEIESAKTVNGVEIKKDESGILKVGDTIIPQKKVIETNLNATTTLSEESQSISLTIPNVQLETGKHYKLIGQWQYGVFKTKIIYDLYVLESGINYSSISMNVLAGVVGYNIVDFSSVTVKSSISGTDTTLLFQIANNNGTMENFKIDNIVTITDIYEIIE